MLECRICAISCDYTVSIFADNETSNNLNEMIKKHLPIQITEKDPLCSSLCYQCASVLLSWQELLDKCIKSDEIFKSRINILENSHIKDCNKDNEGQRINERISHLPFDSFYQAQKSLRDPNYLAKTCLERLEQTSKRHLAICKYVDLHENKLLSDDNNDNENYSAENFDLCNSSPGIDNIKEESTNSYNHDSTRIYDKLSSVTLQNIYKAVYNLRDHFEKVHEKKKFRNSLTSDSDISSDENDVYLFDEFSNDISYDNSSLKYDDLTINNRRRDFFDNNTREALSKAKTLINGKIYYICPVCGKDLRSTHTYIFHMRIHSGEKPCVCHLCGKQFRVNAGLQRHVKETHHKIKMHACDTCGRSFVNRQNLIQHLRIHTGERPYVCSQCGKRFKQSGSLYIHTKTHTDHYPFQCNTCEAKFRQRSGLTHHMYKHTGEKPNVCSFCGKAYRVKHELNIHMLMHTDQRPYVCPVCGFAFRQRRTMRNHCKKAHDCEIN